MPAEIVDIDLGFDDFLDSTKKLGLREVEVGYQQGEGGGQDGVDLTGLAIIHEMGSKDIPARPFMRLSFDNNETEIGKTGAKLLDKYLDGKIDAELTLEAWGDSFRNIVMNGVVTRELGLKENAPSTIERKGSDTPLIDSSRMINGSTVKVDDK